MKRGIWHLWVCGIPALLASVNLGTGVAREVSAGELADLVSGNTAFALDLYHALAEGSEENLFFSPYSISLALAMTYAGARGETAAQMAQALHFTLPQERLHSAFQVLSSALAKEGEEAPSLEGRPFKLRVANALWAQEGHPFLPTFLDLLAENYGARLERVDFITDPEKARLAINAWVKEKTEGKIPELLEPRDVNRFTRLVLTNAIYFNAAWHYPFDEKLTSPAPFHLLHGSQVLVPMMHRTEFFAYAEGPDYQAVELPYRGRDGSPSTFSMVILLPKPGQFPAFEGAFSSEKLRSILGQLGPKNVALALPKFRFRAKFRLREALCALGMPLAFSPQADFSGMDGARDLYIDNVIHEAFVAVDEAGTEAAAATAVVVRITAAPFAPVEMRVDRPFLFLIREKETGAILFLGRVMNPAS